MVVSSSVKRQGDDLAELVFVIEVVQHHEVGVEELDASPAVTNDNQPVVGLLHRGYSPLRQPDHFVRASLVRFHQTFNVYNSLARQAVTIILLAN